MTFRLSKRSVIAFSTALTIMYVLMMSASTAPAKSKQVTKAVQNKNSEKSELTLKQAQQRAKILHDTFHITLQVVHRQYFRQDEKVQIPSRTLDTVFERLSEKHNIKFRWISVNAQAMNIDHEPETKFQKAAAKAIATGKESYEQIEDNVYHSAGRIQLLNQCLKCHLPDRTSTKTRFAALIISMKLKK